MIYARPLTDRSLRQREGLSASLARNNNKTIVLLRSGNLWGPVRARFDKAIVLGTGEPTCRPGARDITSERGEFKLRLEPCGKTNRFPVLLFMHTEREAHSHCTIV